MNGPEASRANIAHLNFENPPEGHLLTAETLREAATPSCQRGEFLPRGEGQLIQLADLHDIIFYVPLDLVVPNLDQPREDFDEKKMDELEAMILDKGQRKAITAIPFIDDSGQVKLFIEDGERRYRILKDLGATYIRVEIQFEATFRAIFEAAAIANLGQATHNPIEEAKILRRMINWAIEEDQLDRQAAIKKSAAKIGKNVKFVEERLALLELDEMIQRAVIEGLSPKAAFELAAQRKKYGEQVNVVQITQRLLDDPEETFDSERERQKHLATMGREQVRAAVRESMRASGGETGRETAERSEASQLTLDFVSTLTTFLNRSRRLLEREDLRGTTITIMQERRGYPPDIIFEKTEELLDLIRAVYTLLIEVALQPAIPKEAQNIRELLTTARNIIDEMLGSFQDPEGFAPEEIKSRIERLLGVLAPVHEKIVIPALQPPPLKIPEGAPPFTNRVRESKDEFQSLVRFRIAEILAQASDNNGQVLTSAMISQKLNDQFKINVNAQSVGVHIQRYLLAELRPLGLIVDTQIVRRRSGKGLLEKIPAYRLAWKN